MGCGDGELVMVVEGAVKKPPPGRVTFPTQVIIITLTTRDPVEKASVDDD